MIAIIWTRHQEKVIINAYLNQIDLLPSLNSIWTNQLVQLEIEVVSIPNNIEIVFIKMI